MAAVFYAYLAEASCFFHREFVLDFWLTSWSLPEVEASKRVLDAKVLEKGHLCDVRVFYFPRPTQSLLNFRI